jgi:hypothetical protein
MNAYKTAAKLSIEQNTIIKKEIMFTIQLSFDYQHIHEVMRILKPFDIKTNDLTSMLFCEWKLSIPVKFKKDLIRELDEKYFIRYTTLNET